MKRNTGISQGPHHSWAVHIPSGTYADFPLDAKMHLIYAAGSSSLNVRVKMDEESLLHKEAGF